MKKLIIIMLVIAACQSVSAQATKTSSNTPVTTVADTSLAKYSLADSSAVDTAAAKTALSDDDMNNEDLMTAEESKGLHKQLKTKFIEGNAGFMSLVALALVLGLAFCIARIIYLTL